MIVDNINKIYINNIIFFYNLIVEGGEFGYYMSALKTLLSLNLTTIFLNISI